MRNLRLLSFGLCLALVAVGSGLAAQDVTGKWVLSVELDDGQGGDATFEFEQEGEDLTGIYTGALGEAELIGTVKGEEIEFSFDSLVGTVTYKGKISGTTMEGTCEYGQLGPGSFKGEKQE